MGGGSYFPAGMASGSLPYSWTPSKHPLITVVVIHGAGNGKRVILLIISRQNCTDRHRQGRTDPNITVGADHVSCCLVVRDCFYIAQPLLSLAQLSARLQSRIVPQAAGGSLQCPRCDNRVTYPASL